MYKPCRCSGSIQYVHEECLQQWLKHSGKNSCELCGNTYEFEPNYKPGTPDIIENTLLASFLTKKLVTWFIPTALHWICAVITWLIVMPTATSWIYRMWMREWPNEKLWSFFSNRLLREVLKIDAISGLVITLAIGAQFMVMMSFIDFLRLFWVQNGDGDMQLQFGAPRQGARQQPGPQQAQQEQQHAREAVAGDVREAALRNVQPAPAVLARERPPVREQLHRGRNALHQGTDQVADYGGQAGAASDEEDSSEVESIWSTDEEVDFDDASFAGEVEEEEDFLADAPDHIQEEIDEILGEELPQDPAAPPADIRQVLLEVLGMRGPFITLLRNAAWLIAFNGVFIGFFAAMPRFLYNTSYSLTSLTISEILSISKIQEISTEFQKFRLQDFNLVWPAITATSAISTFIKSAELWAGQNDIALHIHDVLELMLGYLVLVTSVFISERILSNLPASMKSANWIVQIADVAAAVATVIKVGCLLLVRIFVLPIFLGTCILLGYNYLAHFSQDQWSQFAAGNFVGVFALTWVLGIFYLLTITLSVLQLREVLHPDLLSKFIRPQEANIDLLSSLISESAWTHMKRVCISFLVYFVLLLALVYLPIYILSKIFSPETCRIRFWYGITELQLPLEVAIAHIMVLGALERKKNVLGKIQYRWLVPMCEYLGLTRYLLPCPAIWHRRPDSAGNAIAKTDPAGNILARAPLRRPPAGWDSRTYAASDRWAWNNEPMTPLEASLAPRVKPSFCQVRICMLLFLAWSTCMVIELLIFIIPLSLGRFTFQMLRIPSRFQHDPVAMMIGLSPYLVVPDLMRSYSTWSWALKNIGRLPLRVLGMILVAIPAILFAMMATGSSFTVLIDGRLPTEGQLNGPALVIGVTLWYLVVAVAKVGLLSYASAAMGFESPLLPLEVLWVRFTEDFSNYKLAVSSGVLNEDLLTRENAPQLNLTASNYLPIIQQTCILAPVFCTLKYSVGPLYFVGLISQSEQAVNTAQQIWGRCQASPFAGFCGTEPLELMNRSALFGMLSVQILAVMKTLLLRWLNSARNVARDEYYLLGKRLKNYIATEPSAQ